MRLATKFSSHSNVILLAGALLASTALIGTAVADYTGYRVTKVIPLPGKNPRWDHVSVDPENRNVFIGRRDQGVWVYNIDSSKVSQIENTKGTNGAAVAPELGEQWELYFVRHHRIKIDIQVERPNQPSITRLKATRSDLVGMKQQQFHAGGPHPHELQ